MNVFFVIIRAATGIASLGAFALLSLVLFLRNAASTAKEGVQVLGYVTKLFATAFTEGTAPRAAGWHISAWQIMIGVLALAIFVSVFTPGTRWLLHSVAALAVVVMIGYAKMIFTGMSMEIVCLPFLAVWFGYYAMCPFWQGRVPAN